MIVDESVVEIERCKEEITSFSYAIANLEIEHEIGKVDEENYKNCFCASARNTETRNSRENRLRVDKKQSFKRAA